MSFRALRRYAADDKCTVHYTVPSAYHGRLMSLSHYHLRAASRAAYMLDGASRAIYFTTN